MSYDAFDIKSQEATQEAVAAKAKLAARVEKEDLLWLMRDKRGRRIAHRFLRNAGVWRLSFNTNAAQMAFNEGRRNEGLALTAKLTEYCPETYAQMLQENRNDE